MADGQRSRSRKGRAWCATRSERAGFSTGSVPTVRGLRPQIVKAQGHERGQPAPALARSVTHRKSLFACAPRRDTPRLRGPPQMCGGHLDLEKNKFDSSVDSITPGGSLCRQVERSSLRRDRPRMRATRSSAQGQVRDQRHASVTRRRPDSRGISVSPFHCSSQRCIGALGIGSPSR